MSTKTPVVTGGVKVRLALLSSRVLDGATIQIDRRSRSNAVGIVVAGLHRVSEHQRRTTSRRYSLAVRGVAPMVSGIVGVPVTVTFSL